MAAPTSARKRSGPSARSKAKAPARTTAAQRAHGGRKQLNIALQGGGAHGAYAWGVLDQLLADDRIEIEAISGTSAGAMNAVVVAEGLVEGGRTQARHQLEQFWHAISEEARFSPIRRTAWDVLSSNWNLDHNPMLAAIDAFTHAVSPYVFNPLNLNPLRDLVARVVDFERVRACQSLQLFVAATNVETGAARVFSNDEMSLDVVMASACLPHLFQAVTIGDAAYWDGGFSGNPALTPFFKRCSASDVLLVQVNPAARREVPRQARDIVNRMNEITFNTALLKELEHVEFVNQALREGRLDGLGYREIHLHRIGGDAFAALSASSKLNAEWAFLTHLRDLGRADAETWLATHFDDLGARATLHLRHKP